MYSRKGVGPRMEPRGSTALVGILVKTYHSKPLETVYYFSEKKEIRPNT